jgi:hypothetical protein
MIQPLKYLRQTYAKGILGVKLNILHLATKPIE